MKKKKGSGLKYIGTNDFSLVPKYLVEQIKPRTHDIDKLYALLRVVGDTFWMLNVLGVFVDHQHIIKGFMWSTFNPITDELFCNMLSIDKEYQRSGILGEAISILKKQMKETNAKRITAITRAPKVLMRYGFKKPETTFISLGEE